MHYPASLPASVYSATVDRAELERYRAYGPPPFVRFAQAAPNSLRRLRPMRRLLPATLTLAALAGGCGSSHSITAHNSLSHGRPLTKAQEETYARDVNLRAADLPGMTAIAAEGEAAPSYVTSEAPRCGGGGALAEPGAIHSSRFTYPLSLSAQGSAPAEAVHSSVRIAGSAARAAKDIAADQSVGVRDCFGRVLRAAGGARGPLVRETVVVSLRPDPLPSGHAGFALAVTLQTVYLSAKPGGHRSPFNSAPLTASVLTLLSRRTYSDSPQVQPRSR
jgi:hypothetical protein